MGRQKILLHACCAPCITYVYVKLSEKFEVIPYFYNPNIVPESEYSKRLDELIEYADKEDFEIIAGSNDNEEWASAVEEYKGLGERSMRCYHCFMFRLNECFRKAGSLNIDYVTTTLTISPHKDAEMINEIGNKLEGIYGIKFLQRNFKKGDGFKKSVKLSKENNFYRQNYCGCIYSKIERCK